MDKQALGSARGGLGDSPSMKSAYLAPHLELAQSNLDQLSICGEFLDAEPTWCESFLGSLHNQKFHELAHDR